MQAVHQQLRLAWAAGLSANLSRYKPCEQLHRRYHLA